MRHVLQARCWFLPWGFPSRQLVPQQCRGRFRDTQGGCEWPLCAEQGLERWFRLDGPVCQTQLSAVNRTEQLLCHRHALHGGDRGSKWLQR